MARGADAAGGEGLQEEVKGEKSGLLKRRSDSGRIRTVSGRYLAERRKAKLSVEALLSVDVDGDQVLAKGAAARGVHNGY